MRRALRLGMWTLVAWFAVAIASAEPRIELASDKSSAELPFSLIDNRIFVQAAINGRGPYHFVFDTGGRNILDLRVAQDLGLALQGAGQETGAGAATQQSWRANVETAVVGDAKMTSQEFLVLSLEPIRKAIGFRRFDGIVGLELFQRFVIDIDYANSTLHFIEPATWTPPRDAGQPIALQFIDGSIPATNAAVDDLRGLFAIDTGDRSSLTLFGPFVKRQALRQKYKTKIEAVTGWGIGGPIPAEVTHVRRFEIGRFKLRDIVTRMPLLKSGVFASADAAGSIGTGVLKRFRTVFDYSRKRMFLTPNASFDSVDPLDRSGLWLSLADEGFQVMSVVDASPAAGAAIKVGDVVTAIDGAAAADLFLVDVREGLKTGEPGTPVRLTLKTTAGTREVTIVLRDLLKP